jgi:hypothetical protein
MSIPQLDLKSIINALLIFSLLFTPNWHSIYNGLLIDIQSIINSLLPFSILLTPYWHKL